MKAFVAARGLNETACPECGAKLKDRSSRCPLFESTDEKRRCKWQPGFRFGGKFWPVTPTEIDATAAEISKMKACPDLVIVDEAMLKSEARK